MSKKILCVGSCGFILSNFVRKVIKDKLDYQVCSIDKISSSKDIHNVYSNRNHNFYIGNTLDKHFLKTVFEIEKPDIVIQGSLTNQEEFLLSNVIGTDNLCQVCEEYGSKLYLLSSDIVYGVSEDEELSHKETDSCVIYSKYMTSLISSEDLVQHSGGTVLRLSNAYGPRSKKQIITDLIRFHLKNETPYIWNVGYDFTHVEDVISAILVIIESGKEKIYNVSSSHQFSEKEVYNEIAKLIELKDPIINQNTNSVSTLFRSSDNSKLRALGWKTQHTLQGWLPSVVQWYLNNQWFLKE